MTNNLKEYIVTLHHHEDLESFYQDMESPGGDLYIPNRKVDVANKRPLSRCTHYLLTADEAELLRNDSRVWAVEPVDMLKVIIKPVIAQTGTFSKQDMGVPNHFNWGLLRCLEGEQRPNWGNGGILNQNATINYSLTGKNVDVIIVDGHFDPNHPEFTENSDGTGGSRVIQLDWNLYSSAANNLDLDGGSILSGSYIYSPYSDDYDDELTINNNHGSHVAGIACGNTQGWAKHANIYNINPYYTNNNNLSSLIIWDYIRAFHRNKAINPASGIKNPTVCNCSYGYEICFPYNYGYFQTGPITYIKNRDKEFSNPKGLSTQEIIQGGVYVDTVTNVAKIPYFSPAMIADIQDAINDGIIVVGAAGNTSSKIDSINGPDYNNYINAKYMNIDYSWYIHRGSSPCSTPDVICVGSIGTTIEEYKATYSNCGPRVDLYAPGSVINSSVNNIIGATSYSQDSRNKNYNLAKFSGTSMAAPQVAGVVACILEKYPNLKQQDVKKFLIQYAKENQIADDKLGQESTMSLQGSSNRYLYAPIAKEQNAQTYPYNTYYIRPSEGVTYPRIKRTRY